MIGKSPVSAVLTWLSSSVHPTPAGSYTGNYRFILTHNTGRVGRLLRYTGTQQITIVRMLETMANYGCGCVRRRLALQYFSCGVHFTEPATKTPRPSQQRRTLLRSTWIPYNKYLYHVL